MEKEKWPLKDKVKFVFMLVIVTSPIWFPILLIVAGE